MRLLGSLIACAALVACSANHALPPGSGGAGTNPGTGVAGGGGAGGSAGAPIVFTQSINRNVDIVFMIDNSSGMTVLQSKLIATFSAYIDVLTALPGGLPNIHLGVVSSSMGAGRNPGIEQCPPGGDQGIFQTRQLGGPACTKATLNAGQNFIIDVNGQSNHTGDIVDAFSCIAPLGERGCGFEHQLESVLRALGADGAAAPAQNAGFLRPDAYLQVILLTNEDDCSAPPDSDLFDNPSDPSTSIDSMYGPLQSYRCNEFGHVCGGQRPPRKPPGEVDLSGTCVSAEDGRLLRIIDVATALKHLKADPSKVFVAAITGPPNPYKVNAGPSQIEGDASLWPYVEHSCIQNEPGGSQTYADPSVRINQLVNAFGTNGAFEGLCAADFAPLLRLIAGQIASVMGSPCLPANADPSKCQLTDAEVTATGATSNVPLHRCMDAADAGPCWDVQTSATSCPPGSGVVFRRPAGSPEPETTTATCLK